MIKHANSMQDIGGRTLEVSFVPLHNLSDSSHGLLGPTQELTQLLRRDGEKRAKDQLLLV